jgi:hypothetical protein
MLAQERGRLTVTLAGSHGDRVPLTLPEFLDWARSLASTELAEAIEGLAPLDDGAVFRFPANRRRGYERLRAFPERLVVTGDALCSFDPVFGQGMTVAALEALELGRSLDEGLAGLARRFHARAAVHIDTPWLIAAGGTPPDGGRISLGERLAGRYVAALQRAAVSDPVLAEAFLRVSHLVDRPRELMRPGRAVRVLAGSLRSRRRPGEARRLPAGRRARAVTSATRRTGCPQRAGGEDGHMDEHLSRAEIGKDAVQHTIEAAATTAGQVASIITGAVRDVAKALGGFATEVFEIRDAARKAGRD